MKNLSLGKRLSNNSPYQCRIPLQIVVMLIIFSCFSSCRFLDDLEDLLKDQDNVKKFTVDLDPLNNSGVSGKATLTLEGNHLTVEIYAKGLEANRIHAQHIHGLEDNSNATCPTLTADTNQNGIVEIGEGLPYYGPVLLPLEPFSEAPDGMIKYEQTFILGEDEVIAYEDLKPLPHRVIVLHGLTVGGEYVGSLPVACGEIREKDH